MSNDAHLEAEPFDCPSASTYIVIPAYNESTRLAGVINDLRKDFPHVVVVDDGSRDETAQVAADAGCAVLRHIINRGQGAALQTGITYALRQGAEYVVTFDADGQHQKADLDAMLEPVVKGEVDVTLGSRFLDTRSEVPPLRRMLLQAARFFTWFTSGLYLSDCHNGFRVFSRKAAEALHIQQDRMAHASEIYDQIAAAGLRYREVPVTIRYTAETLAKGQRASNSVSVLFQYLFSKMSR
jgi:glycosyltransferase involved in cell wall biosynthesis